MDKQWETETVESYDIAELEEKNGIHAVRSNPQSEKGTTEQLEEKLGISSKEEQAKKIPKERVEPEGTAKTSYQAKKNGVRNKKNRDDRKKKREKGKSSKRSGAMKNAAKREMKNVIVNQILKEEEDSGLQEANSVQTVLTEYFKSMGKRSAKLAYKGMKYILGLLAEVFILLLGLLLLLVPALIVLITAMAVVIAIAVIAGIFVTPENAAKEDFAANRISAYQAELLEEAESYNGDWHWGYYVEEVNIKYKGISNISANSDDMLLAYMANAAEDGDLGEEVNQAPLLNVDTLGEEWAMDEVLKDMLYISDVTYEKCTREIVVTVTPTPTATPAPTVSPTPEPSMTALPTPVQVPTQTPDQKLSPTPIPSPTPTPEPETIIITETYYVVHVTITGVDADAWVTENVGGKEKALYSFLEELFISFGYQALGGDTVCQKYLNADMQ